ncbi:MAG: SRPBCC domain-containing protein [Chloroflexi bacterium]|nr:SRPBCC domain-containing protein [Chloroflexota bacterium]
MKAFDATSLIQAGPDAIWAILTDGSGYTRWDSGVERVEGQIAPGERITVYSQVNPGRAFPVTVTEFNPGQRMVWSGGMPLGLFKGVRTFSLTAQGNGVTRFTMREEYTGPLAPLIGRSIPDLGPSFERFANGLKRRAESAR